MTNRGGNLAGKSKYAAILETVGEVVPELDPYHLLAGGAPSDEWDAEIAAIATQIPRIHSAEDAAEAIAQVFRSSLDEEAHTGPDLAAPGAKLYALLQERGLLP